MSWLINVVVVGTPVGGIAAVKIPLPGADKTKPANFRNATIDLSLLEETPPPPAPTSNEFYPILSSVMW